MGGVYDPKLMQKFVGIGARFVLGGSDVSFIMAGARERATFLRSVKI
jgi:2-keto-3-deoxy-L-rhamnonate aldolase RhmA